MKCSNCGTENDSSVRFCVGCGTALQTDTTQQNQQTQQGQAAPTQYYTQPQTIVMQNNIPPEYEPISMWGYFGYELLFSIPCVGFVLLLVYAFGGTQNYNLKNFARSYFCLLIVAIVLVLILSIAGGIGFLSFFMQ